MGAPHQRIATHDKMRVHVFVDLLGCRSNRPQPRELLNQALLDVLQCLQVA
jgi:hypothetical protein